MNINEDLKNSLGLTKKEMKKQYPDDVAVLNNPVNAHFHWYNGDGCCNICGKKSREIDPD